jgi:hypothetical protein
MFSGKVSLAHVFDLYSHGAFQLYVRPLSEVAEEQESLARDRLDSFLKSEFPVGECPRILLSPGRTDSISSLRADVLVIGRSPQSGVLGRLRDLSYAIARDAPCPVLSV